MASNEDIDTPTPQDISNVFAAADFSSQSLVGGGGMVFDGSGEFRPGIEEACKSCVVLGEELHDFWRTEDSWVGLKD